MDIDIDTFIKDQKSKIAKERRYLSHQNLLNSKFNSGENLKYYDSSIMNIKESENLKNDNDQSFKMGVPNTGKNSSRKESLKFDDKMENNGSLPGLSYSNSASKRKEVIRNQEYNEFKKIDEQKFKDRFANKKNVSLNQDYKSESNLFIPKIPLNTELINMSEVSSLIKSKSSILNNNNGIIGSNNNLDLLEKKVEDLRRYKIQDYPADDHHSSNDDNFTKYDQTQFKNYPLHYSPLKDTENQLLEIEREYDASKSRIMKLQKSELMKRTKPPLNENILSKDKKSIIPMGRDNEESIRRQKQEQYRKDLQDQMKEKSRKPRSAELSMKDEVSFFDRFGAGGSKFKKSDSFSDRDFMTMNTEFPNHNEYFYYASRNPLEEYNDISYKSSGLSDINNGNVKVHDNIDDFKSLGVKSRSTNLTNKENYGEELKRQIEERKIRKLVDKRKMDEYERRKNEEISNYEPFGRGGGGAPLKDFQGDTIADLKNYKPNTNITIPPSSFRSPVMDLSHRTGQSDLELESSARKTFARGGHGIFGQALTEEDKMKAEKYKEELKAQIESNKKKREIEKENERIREEKEREKFDKEQKQILDELEKEKRSQQQKEIERLQRLEESKLAAKQKRLPDMMEIKTQERKEASPIPAGDFPNVMEPRKYKVSLRSSRSPTLKDSSKLKSPLIIRDSIPLDIKRENSDVTRKLHLLKNQILNESAKLEKELGKQKIGDVEFNDVPVMKNRTSENQTQSEFNSDIFQSVLDHKGPLSLRRGFGKIRINDPNLPSANTAESLYLDDHLKPPEIVPTHIEDHSEFSSFQFPMKNFNFPNDTIMRSHSEMSNQLEAETDFITFSQSRDFSLKNSFNEFTDNDLHFTQSSKPYEFGSDTSLNVDELTRKNQQRLRKLQQTKYENEINQTPEDVLNKISRLKNHQSSLFIDH